jgi:hypothetical protein
MSEQNWTVTPVPPEPAETEHRHEAVVDGLEVVITEMARGARWVVHGYLGAIHVDAWDYSGHGRTVDQAKEQAVAAAHALHAVGVRGAKPKPAVAEGEA